MKRKTEKIKHILETLSQKGNKKRNFKKPKKSGKNRKFFFSEVWFKRWDHSKLLKNYKIRKKSGNRLYFRSNIFKIRTFDQLKATHLRASPKQQALLDVLLQLMKTWALTIGPWFQNAVISPSPSWNRTCTIVQTQFTVSLS